MKLRPVHFILCAGVVLGFTACGEKQSPVTDLQRKEAALLISEAQFASTLRNHEEAESLLARAAAVTPDDAALWISLGSVRKRLGQDGPAKQAYERALKLYQAETKAKKAEADPLLQQIHVLALLGRVEEARGLQEKALAQFPEDRDVRAFVQEKRLDRFLADPQFRQIAL